MKKILLIHIILIFSSGILLGSPKVKAYPNPFNPEMGHNQVTIKAHGVSFTVTSMKVEIYDINGDEVFKKTVNSDETTWHGYNTEGFRVKPGLYFIKITCEGLDGMDTKFHKEVFKLLVQY